MNFKNDNEIIQAVMFDNSDEGFNKIKEFVGDAYVKHGCDQVPNAVPWIMTVVNNGNNTHTAFLSANKWVIKHPNGSFTTMYDNIFKTTYTPI